MGWLVFLIFSHLGMAQENRTIDGASNNASHPKWGKSNSQFQRVTSVNYGNGIDSPGGVDLPNPRVISNEFFDQKDFMENSHGHSDFVWNFGQFIDHDITFNDSGTGELLVFDIPSGDIYFDPNATGKVKMKVERSAYDPDTGGATGIPRQQTNQVTSWIDGSVIYGSDTETASWLRTFTHGKLKVSKGDLLPFNTIDGEFDGAIDINGPDMEGGTQPEPTKIFVAGDERANEHAGLVCFHTLFVREHNRLCEVLMQEHPDWNDEQLYQRARKMVGALLQVVTYEEWLPTLGVSLPAYQGYDGDANPNILNVFSSVASRFGHSIVNEQFVRLEETGETSVYGSIHLREVFFKPLVIKDEGGIDPFLRGMATQKQQQLDMKMVGSLRNFLFGPPGSKGLDLIAINILRSREKGLPDYNTIRLDFGLVAKTSYADITDNGQIQNTLGSVYGNINTIDPLVGMLAEEPVEGAIFGELIYTIMQRQFMALRDGDRFWYENDKSFTAQEIDMLKETRLSDIIKRNSEIKAIQDDVFKAENKFITVGIIPFDNLRKVEAEVFPNPFNDHIKVRIKALIGGKAELTIYDVTGRLVLGKELVLTRGDNKFSFLLDTGLKNGLYTLTIKSEGANGQFKLIKH